VSASLPHLPPSPLPLPRWGRGRGRARPHLPPSPLPLPRWGRGRGRALPSLPPRPFTASLVARRARSRTGRGRFPTCPLGGWTRGHMRGVGVAPSPSPGPLPLPRWGRGRGRALPSLPPRPFTASLVARRARSRTGRGRFPTCPLGGWTRGHMRGVGVAPSPSPQPPSSPPLGARKGEGAPSPSPQPLPLPRWGRGRGRALPSLPPRPFTASFVARRARSRPYHTLTT
jgi:hypothetical protein